jgi:hypothetical protein
MTTTVALLPYTCRAVRWSRVGSGFLTSVLFVTVMTLVPVTHDSTGLISILRVAALLGAIGAAFLLDDPSESSTAATPVARRLRVILRPLVLAPAVAIWWMSVVVLARADVSTQVWQAVPLGRISFEAACLMTVAVAIAAFGIRRPPHDNGGTIAAPGMLAFAITGQLVPGRWRLFPTPEDPHWAFARTLWLVLAVIALGLLVWATRDLSRTRLTAAKTRPT